jgi:hypothetical protein
VLEKTVMNLGKKTRELILEVENTSRLKMKSATIADFHLKLFLKPRRRTVKNGTLTVKEARRVSKALNS